MKPRLLNTLLALFFLGCQSAAPSAPEAPPNSNRVIFGPSSIAPKDKTRGEPIPGFERYFPRTLGQKRAWRIEYRQGQELMLRGRREQELLARRSIDGRDYFVSRWSLTLDDPRQKPRSGELLERLSDEGLFERDDDQDHRRIAFPLTIGEAWFEARDDWAISYVVEGIEAIKVADKTYEDCIKIRGLLTHKEAEKNQVIETYYARDIGRVYQVIYENQDRTRTLALIAEPS